MLELFIVILFGILCPDGEFKQRSTQWSSIRDNWRLGITLRLTIRNEESYQDGPPYLDSLRYAVFRR